MANIYDVARLARVSTTTVSKVLSNTPYVSEKTRQRVLDAMRALHYSPSLAARGLTNNRTYVLGLIIPHDPDYSFRDPFLLEVIRGVESVASNNDYNVLLSMSKKASQRTTYDRFLRTGYIDGVITVETLKGELDEQELATSGVPRVSAGYREDLQLINAVNCDDRQGGYAVTKHLLELGHRRIGVISGPANFIGAMDERLQGACDALAEYGLGLDTNLLTYGDFSIESGSRAAEPLLQREERPTAIFAMNDRMALGAIGKAHELGLHVPEYLSVVGFDDIPLTSVIDPPLTTIRQFPAELGKIATQRLLAMINQGIMQFEAVVIPVELVVRKSTAVPMHENLTKKSVLSPTNSSPSLYNAAIQEFIHISSILDKDREVK
ncbi:MAG: LacI family DNA-binding transcriptional regulator [Ktedonobacteraceae bacterium]